jgi:ATP phosphoribosyltransferase
MIRFALPTGDLRRDTAALLERAGMPIAGYASGSRALRFDAIDGAAVARVFREKDIPVQVALGAYDAGICSLAWVEELTRRFPRHEVVRLCELPYGARELWLATAPEPWPGASLRVVSEFPNIADAIARSARFPRYHVYGVWGAAEAYPPEDADVALIEAPDAAAVAARGLRPIARVLRSSAWLIANRRALASRDVSALIGPLLGRGNPAVHGGPALEFPPASAFPAPTGVTTPPRRALRVALPDGHAQTHTVAALRAAGIDVEGYDDQDAVRRPRMPIDGVEVKVIRPQDMPQQVAIGQFDLAITGRDWLFDHTVQFPSSPVAEVVDLRRSRYGLAAIVKDVRADTVAGAVREWRSRSDGPIRVASEYPNIADHFARDRHLGRYSVIPIAGASEGFVPDDAEILIEGIDTGSSVRANNLTVLERFFESTNCVIARTTAPQGELRALYDGLLARLEAGARETAAVTGS